MASVSKIRQSFRGLSDNTNLTDVTGWTTNTRTGSGNPRTDTHTDHAYSGATDDIVIDMSNTGYARALHTTDTLDDADQSGEIFWFADTYNTNDSTSAQAGILLRVADSDAADVNGYHARFVATDGSTAAAFDVFIEKVVADSETTLASATGVQANGPLDRYSIARLTFTVVGSTLTAYLNGDQVLQTTDTTYSTGSYVGFSHDRPISATHSQPFVSEFAAWTGNETGLAHTEPIEGSVTSQWGTNTTTNATSMAVPVAPAADQLLVAVLQVKDNAANSTPTLTSFVDDGTGSWTTEASHSVTNNTTTWVFSKVAAGDETTVTATFSLGRGWISMLALPDGWDYETSDFTTEGAAVTGTLSSDDKLGIALEAASSTTWLKDATFDRAWGVALPEQTTQSNMAHFGHVMLHDLGTATTAWTVDSNAYGTGSVMGAVVLAYSAGAGTVTVSPNDAAHAHAADQASVSVSVTVSPNDADHAHTADATTVTTSVTVSPADSDHDHTADEPTVAVSVTVSPADAAHAHTADEPAVSTSLTVAPADADHAHTADAPSVSVSVAVAPAAADHGHTADEPAVSTSLTVSPADADHAHTADAPSVSVSVAVAPNAADHGHTADEPLVTTSATAIPDDAGHAHTADTPTVSVSVTVSPNDSAHAHAADTPTVSTSLTVSPADTLHGHTADTPTITVPGVAAPNNSTHAHTADEPAVTISATVAPNNASHAHTADAPTITTTATVAPNATAHAHTVDTPTVTVSVTVTPNDALHAHAADSADPVPGVTYNSATIARAGARNGDADVEAMGGTSRAEIWLAYAASAGRYFDLQSNDLLDLQDGSPFLLQGQRAALGAAAEVMLVAQ